MYKYFIKSSKNGSSLSRGHAVCLKSISVTQGLLRTNQYLLDVLAASVSVGLLGFHVLVAAWS